MGTKTVECLECGGEGSYDSGGSTPWGEWINVPCGRCNGKGAVPIEELTDEELRFIATSPVSLAAPDLLSLLKEIIGEIDDWAHEDVIKRAEALIAKIEL